MKEIISNQADAFADNACTLMSEEERGEFLSNCKVSPTYVKGKNKGKPREVFTINGTLFNKLWNIVKPYVYTSAMRSNYFNAVAAEDDIAEVKYLMFRYLRFLGPRYNGLPFSKVIPLLTNNVLTNSHTKRSTSVATTSLYAEIFNEEDELVTSVEVSKVEAKDNSVMRDVELYSDIPAELLPAVQMIVGGCTLQKISKDLNIPVYILKSRLQKGLSFLKHSV